jgi:hypothetical protein
MRFPYLPDILIQTLPSGKSGSSTGNNNSLFRALLEIACTLDTLGKLDGFPAILDPPEDPNGRNVRDPAGGIRVAYIK